MLLKSNEAFGNAYSLNESNEYWHREAASAGKFMTALLAKLVVSPLLYEVKLDGTDNITEKSQSVLQPSTLFNLFRQH
jgi:hypothetical protein